ncbi:MAG: hypothetical protein ACYC63_10610 [Armatimonadota bacterium]
MFLRALFVIAAALIIVVTVNAEEVPAPSPAVVPNPNLSEPPGSMPTMQISPEVAVSSVAGGVVHGIKPEIVAESVEGTVRALVTILPQRRQYGFRARRGIEGAIGRRLLPGVSISTP